MNGTIRNDSRRDETTAPKPVDTDRSKSVEDLKDLGLLSFRDKAGLTPIDTLFDRTAAPTKEDSKVRPIF